jgi:hypothetical protein
VTLIGPVVTPNPPLFGVTDADNENLPITLGDQLHVAVIFGEVPVVAILRQFGILLPFAEKETLDATAAFTVIPTGVR